MYTKNTLLMLTDVRIRPKTTLSIAGRRHSLMRFTWIAIIIFLFVQCTQQNGLPSGDSDNGGLYLPIDFEAVVVVDSLKGRARHLTVNQNGDIYVKLRFPDTLGGNAALRDSDNDGKADIIKTFGNYLDRSSYGTEMRIYNGYLYFSSVTRIFRQKLTDQLIPDTEMELILLGRVNTNCIEYQCDMDKGREHYI